MKNQSTPSSSARCALACLAVLTTTAFLPTIANAQLKVLTTFPESALQGAKPDGGGVVVGNQYFGTTNLGGVNGNGVLFRVNLNGTGFTKLKDFTTSEGRPEYQSYSSTGRLIAAGGQLYGTVAGASDNWEGVLYRIDTSGSGFTKIFEFNKYLYWSGSDSVYTSRGYYPSSKFIDGTTIYGICGNGGNGSGSGTLFKINIDGTGFQEIYDFQGGADGSQPVDIVDGGTVIYGITRSGGIADKGTIFKVNKDGTGYQQLRYMMESDVYLESIAISGSKLYISSSDGGQVTSQIKYPDGFIASINTDGSGYKFIKTLDYSTTKIEGPTHILINNNLIYGVCEYGGTGDFSGGIFKMNFDGSGFSQLAAFSDLDKGTTGSNPSSLIFNNGVLYGTNSEGGTGGQGTVYSLSVGGSSPNPTPPPLPTTQAMYGTVTFTATAFFPQSSAPTTKKSGNVQTLTEPAKMATYSISNALVLKLASDAALIPSTSGYSIVCPDDFESGIQFFAYKKGSPLVSLSPIISFTEAVNVQAATKITTTNLSTFAETVSQSGTEKSYGTGQFNDMSVAMNRTINFKSGTVKINGINYSYYPSTTTGTFFGGSEDGTLFVEGKFSVGASTPITIPAE